MPWVPEVSPDHPYADDLDIVGRASLFQLLDTTATRMGRETLAAWLLAPADPMVATARQGAVAELAPLLDLRQEIELRGRAASGIETDPEPFLAWAEDPHGLGDRAWLRWVAWLGPIAVVALGIADLSGVIAGAALGRAASGESARRRDGRTASLRHHRRGRDRAAGYCRLRRPARGAGCRRFHGSRVAASPGTVGNRRARRAGHAAPSGAVDRDGDPALVRALCADPGADALGRARPVRVWSAGSGTVGATLAAGWRRSEKPRRWPRSPGYAATIPTGRSRASSGRVIPIAPPCSATRCSVTIRGCATTSRLARPVRSSW